MASLTLKDWGIIAGCIFGTGGFFFYIFYLVFKDKYLDKLYTKKEDCKMCMHELTIKLEKDYIDKDKMYKEFMSKEFCVKNHETTNLMIRNIEINISELKLGFEKVRNEIDKMRNDTNAFFIKISEQIAAMHKGK